MTVGKLLSPPLDLRPQRLEGVLAGEGLLEREKVGIQSLYHAAPLTEAT